MIQIIKANKIDKNINIQMSKLFVYSFFDIFSSYCSDKEKLIKAFKNIFDTGRFYIALLGEEIIGMVAVSDGSSPIKFNRFRICRYLGIKNGKNMFEYLNDILVKRDYDFVIDEKCGMIEFLAVKEEYRDKKVGFTLVNHVIRDNNYIRYLSKIADNNFKAKGLFENIGFEEFHLEEATNKEKNDI